MIGSSWQSVRSDDYSPETLDGNRPETPDYNSPETPDYCEYFNFIGFQ